ncbi:MAG: dTDP-glucose 4,6-dehydratase [Holosporales bacterium]|nr:dTDP-glucose 4,6-dehydratase [Holosporales bacterium]
MNIIVTGGAGFIGSTFVRRALRQGHKVTNIDKLTYAGSLDNLRDCVNPTPPPQPNYRFFQEDVCDRPAILSILSEAQPEVIVHMAAETHVDRSIECADQFVRTNVLGTQAMLDAALNCSKKSRKPLFLYISTDEVFGSIPGTGRFSEESPYRPNSPYAASKAASDFLVRSYRNTYGLRTITVNASNNYGPYQFPEKLIPLSISNALKKLPIPIYGDGMQVRDWLYVEDHVDALFSLIDKGREGESYCIGADCERNNLDVIRQICGLLSQKLDDEFDYESLITHVKDRLGHDLRYATDSSKLRTHTEWTPTTSFEEGLSKTVDWYIKKSSNNCSTKS